MLLTMEELEHIADAQHGVFNLTDAERGGVTRRAVESRRRAGRYERVGPSTYRIVGASPTWRQEVMRAVAAAGLGAAASHTTALALHRVVRAQGGIEVVTPRRRRLRLPGVVVHTSTALPTEDVVGVSGIPTTTIERSLLDFAATAGRDRLSAAIDHAIASDLTTADDLGVFLQRRRRRGRPGVIALEQALDRPSLGAVESRYERTLFELLGEAGFTGTPQFEVRDPFGGFVARVDLAFPSHRLAIEVDGHEFHSSRDQRAADSTRQNRLLTAGWTVLRFTTDQVFHRDPAIVRTVRRALDRSPFLRR